MAEIREEPFCDKNGLPIGLLVTMPNGDVQAYDANGHYMGFARKRDQVTFDRYWQYMAKEFKPSILIERVKEELVRDNRGKPIARLVTLATGNVQVYTMKGSYQGMSVYRFKRIIMMAADGRCLREPCDLKNLILLKNPWIGPEPVAWKNNSQQSLFAPPEREASCNACESGIKTLNGIWYYSAEREKIAAILKEGWEPRIEEDLRLGTGIYLSSRRYLDNSCCIKCELEVDAKREIHQFPSQYGCGCDSRSFFCYLWEMGLHVRLRSEPGMAPENRAIASHFLRRGYQGAHICDPAGFAGSPTVVVYDPSIIVKASICT
jgi:hypothetical protein